MVSPCLRQPDVLPCRITDPEILERRYPVVLHQFILREGSGGAGKFRGGDGIIREVVDCCSVALSGAAAHLLASLIRARKLFQHLGQPITWRNSCRLNFCAP